MKRLAALNLNLLVALDALLEHQSVTRAAQVSSVTQSAMSQSLAQLRDVFDDPLLVRSGRRMVPTPRAVALRPPLRRLLLQLDQLVGEGPTFDPATAERTFHIAAADIVAWVAFVPLRRRIAPVAPHVGLDFVSLQSGRLLEALENGTLDFAIDAFLDDASLRSVEIPSAPGGVRVVMRPGHPSAPPPGERFDMPTWLDLPHLLVATSTPDVNPLDAWLARQGMKRRIAGRVPGFAAAACIVAASDLVLNAPMPVVGPAVSQLGLEDHPTPFDAPDIPIRLYWHPRWENDPAHRWMREQIASIEIT